MGKRNGQNFMLQEEYSIPRKLEAMPDRLISSASLREIGMIPKANNIRPITHIMLWGIPIAREYAHGKGISVFVHKSDVLKVLGNSEFVPLFMARKLIGLPRIGGGDLKIFAAAHEVSIDREFIPSRGCAPLSYQAVRIASSPRWSGHAHSTPSVTCQ